MCIVCYMVLIEKGEEVMLFFSRVYEHLLQHVIGQTYYLQCFHVPQRQRGYLIIRNPFLCCLCSLTSEDLQALLNHLLHAFSGHLNYMTDYKALFEEKCRDFEELSEQLTQFQNQSNLIINDLEEQLKQLKKKNEALSKQSHQQKQKYKCFKSSIEREVELAQRQRNQFKKKFVDFQKKVIELEIVNENLESELRSTKATLFEYEARTEKTMEELAITRMEIEQAKQNNKQYTARLHNQLKETEEELYAIRQIKERKQEQEQERRENHLAQSDVGVSQLTTSNTNPFKQTLKGIREYLSTLDSRKAELRKLMLKA